jgi:phthalate 4,5-dioxygenase oxygenase subunit
MDAQENQTMTRVGPGTPAGETLRRYWLPINFSDEVKTDEPKIVRRLAEDLLLFRDEFGRVGLTEPVCPHRGTSLEYGWIEAGGIRCCYHGWVYDVTGRCIEQPGEPAGSNFKDKDQAQSLPDPRARRDRLGLHGSWQPAAFSTLRFSRARRRRAHAQ